MRRSPLTRKSPLSSGDRKPLGRSPKRRAISSASEAQRAKVRSEVCVVCQSEHVDPAHLIDRSLGGDDDPRAVVGLCRAHHDAYDNGRISLVEYLEPHYREEVAYAVMTVGIVRALERLTNERWTPVERAA